MIATARDYELIDIYQHTDDGWNQFCRDILQIRLDWQQREIIKSIQHNRRVSVRSGNARGKDYVAAAAALCNLYLRYPSKTILTAPTGRQVLHIMMPEISKMYRNSLIPLGGELLTSMIKIPGEAEWYLIGFKAADKSIEAWGGFHSPNIMIIVTEASGLEQITFNAIEGILPGDSRLVLIFNPNRTMGEAFRSTRSPLYKKFKLNSLKSVNVRAKKILIPGQVDWEWINEKVHKPGWTAEIRESEFNKSLHDFKWEGKYYRPSDLFLVRVLAEFPREASDVLIPLSWIEEANQRWIKIKETESLDIIRGDLKIGVDVAGMGRDYTVFAYRRKNFVEGFETMFNAEKSETIHMQVSGKIHNELKKEGMAFIDTIGEGAGVYARNMELGDRVINCKGSYSAQGLTDLTEEREFFNMRAYLHWALRDCLNPAFGINFALPPNDELMQELVEMRFEVKSNGKIIIEDKKKIKERIGRSPDYTDALINTFFPLDMEETVVIGEIDLN